MYLSMEIKCQNEGNGCIVTMLYEKFNELEKHGLECDFQKVKCLFKGCHEEILKLKYDNH